MRSTPTWPRLRHWLVRGLLALASLGLGGGSAGGLPSAHAASGPSVRLNRLRLPDSPLVDERYLRKLLERQARKLDWGASAGSIVEYRFVLQRLDVSIEKDVLTVHCAAVGSLPKGLTAKSQLSFGGEPKQRDALIKKVVGIVAHGVLTRLAELERERRAVR